MNVKEFKKIFMQTEDYKKTSEEVLKEVIRAKTLFPVDFHNAHEGYAVILEELDELWQEVKKNQRDYDIENQRKEAIQCAAMCIRFATELCKTEKEKPSIPVGVQAMAHLFPVLSTEGNLAKGEIEKFNYVDSQKNQHTWGEQVVGSRDGFDMIWKHISGDYFKLIGKWPERSC